MDVRAQVDGADAWGTALESRVARTRAATDKAVDAGLNLIQVGAQQNLAYFSHPPGTPTPSAPGEPPALVSGALRRSIRVRRTKRGPGQYEGRVGPTIIYARIQELGGQLGRNPRHGMWRSPGFLPPRPYFQPAVFNARPKIARLFRDAWAKTLGGG